jgi:hypothetical protein
VKDPRAFFVLLIAQTENGGLFKDELITFIENNYYTKKLNADSTRKRSSASIFHLHSFRGDLNIDAIKNFIYSNSIMQEN